MTSHPENDNFLDVQEREPNRIQQILAGAEALCGGVIILAAGETAVIGPEEVKNGTSDVPTSMGQLLQITSEAGIPTEVTLITLATLGSTALIHGLARFRSLRGR